MMSLTERANKAVEDSSNFKFSAIEQSRKDFALRHFVIGQQDTLPMQWHQCVLEISEKRSGISSMLIELRRHDRRVDRLKRDMPEDWDLDIESMALSRSRLESSVLNATRELECLNSIYNELPECTIEELEQAQTEYWKERLTRQAKTDLMSMGRVGIGNIEALRQAEMLDGFFHSITEEKKAANIEQESCNACG